VHLVGFHFWKYSVQFLTAAPCIQDSHKANAMSEKEVPTHHAEIAPYQFRGHLQPSDILNILF
jgi:hypothetical protein